MEAGAGDLVGRSSEMSGIRSAVHAAARGHGRTVFVIGEPGIGKTRLTTAAIGLAVELGVVSLRGRASTVGPMLPLRPLAEALMGLSRAGMLPDPDCLGPYAGMLAQLLPELAPAETTGAAPPRPIMIAEAVLRLLSVVGRERGTLLVLDDMHDADAETLAVAEYLIDNLADSPLSLLLTSRVEVGAAADLAIAARQRGAADVLEPRRLTRTEVAELTANLLATEPPQLSADVVDLITGDSAGIPFYIEELVYDLTRTGRLVSGTEGWRLLDTTETRVPESVTRSITQRTDQLGPQARTMLTLAAVIGQRFSLPVLRQAAGTDDRTLLAGLHAGVSAQLVGADEPAPDWYVFRHPLTAEALLSVLTTPERAALSRTAAEAIEALYPDLPGEWRVRSAELWQHAGVPERAGELFAEVGREALAEGAVASAVRLLVRSEDLLATAGDAAAPATKADVLDSLLYAIAESGRFEHIAAVVAALADLARSGLPNARLATLHAQLANVVTLSGDRVGGRRNVDVARELLGPDAEDADIARVDAIAAFVELNRPGPDRLEIAARLAGRAAAAAERAGLAATACDALQLQGYLTRYRDERSALGYFERAAKIADANGLRVWRMYSDLFIARGALITDGDTEPLDRVVLEAIRLGVLPMAYETKGALALDLVHRAEYERAETYLDQTIADVTRLRLGRALPFLELVRAALYAHRGQREEMSAVLDPLESAADRVSYLPHAGYGLARAICALVEDDAERATDDLVRAVAYDIESPIVMDYGRYGLALLLGVLSGRAGWREYQTITTYAASQARWNAQFVRLAHAVLLGRDGDQMSADTEARAARQAAELYPLARHLGWRLVAQHAQEDGWGEPVEWLRQAEQYFHEGPCPAPALAVACRGLLRQMGAMVRQRRTGSDRIPEQLRRLGVTIREYEVAELLAERIGNKAIGGRLHISPRTVEKHVANLLAKTGEPDRESFASNARAVHGILARD